jgi:hypothetical protein
MTDLERFVELYRSFGIECKVTQFPKQEGQFIVMREAYGVKEVTESKKLDGHLGFYSDVQFDENGKFLRQGFWE